MLEKLLQKLFPRLYPQPSIGEMIDKWAKSYVHEIPLYQEPTDHAVQVSTPPKMRGPVFESSKTLKIVGFKEGDDPKAANQFLEVKPEFILDGVDRMVYLGEKPYVLPIYKVKSEESCKD